MRMAFVRTSGACRIHKRGLDCASQLRDAINDVIKPLSATAAENFACDVLGPRSNDLVLADGQFAADGLRSRGTDVFRRTLNTFPRIRHHFHDT